MPMNSFLFMDALQSPDDRDPLYLLKKRCQKLDFSIFQGLYPHLTQIYYDPVGEQIGTFQDYNTLVVFPLLHQNEIKLKYPGTKSAAES
jgi:hypothetical protein